MLVQLTNNFGFLSCKFYLFYFICSTTDSLDLCLPTPKRPCHLSVKVSKQFSHDFKAGNPLFVPFQVTAENKGTAAGRLHFKADKDW
jgi:hypothetical protein